MGLFKTFLADQGFITDDRKPVLPTGKKEASAPPASTSSSTFLTTTFSTAGTTTEVQPLSSFGKTPKEAFIKFFEDAMTAANLPGEDYYEFRTQLSKMRERMGSRTNEDALLESVLINFEAKNLFPKDLIAFADHYLEALTLKKDQFIKEAASEKVNIQQTREGEIIQAVKDIESKKARIEQMRKDIDALTNEVAAQTNSVDVAKSSITDAAKKIDDSQIELQLAFDFMASNINNEKKILSSKIR